MKKKPTRKRSYFKMESAMAAILRDASGKMHHGILFDPPLGGNLANIMSIHCISFGLSSNMHHQMSGTQEVQGGLQPKGGLVHNRVIFTPVPTRVNKIHS